MTGIGVSSGRAVGPAHVRVQDPRITSGARTWDEVTAARDVAMAELRALIPGAPPEAAAILEAQVEILQDPALEDAVLEATKHGGDAAAALAVAADGFAARLAALPDPYLAARAQDVRQVADRWLAALAGATRQEPLPGTPFVLVAADLGPADTLSLPRDRLLAIATERGGPGSHTAIVARALGIPAAVGVTGLLEHAHEGGWLDVNGDTGEVVAVEAAAAARTLRAKADGMPPGPHLSRDGIRVQILANIGRPGEAAGAAAAGAEGVGLFRTELLFMESAAAPSEEAQYQAYREAVEALGGGTLVVRTLDVGGDKPIPYMPLPPAGNPQLSVRGMRLLDVRPDIMRTQVRALLRAAAHGPVAVMFPMVVDASDIRRCRDLFDEAKLALVQEGLAFGSPALGAMVEIPAAATTATTLLCEADFVSIGTNDLTQYTLAVDRDDAHVAGRYDSLHPGVLRLIAMTGEAGRLTGKPVAVCGELGGDVLAAPLLLAWSVHEWSMAIPAMARMARALAAWDSHEAAEVAGRALEARTAAEVSALLKAEAEARGVLA